jgi:hypothetical protein
MEAEPHQELPAALGGTWKRFHEEWCLGQPLPLPKEQTIVALNALARHSPRLITKAAADTHRSRGPLVVCPLVETGDLLQTVQHVPYFRRVLARLNRGKRTRKSSFISGGRD